jgi:hypothetical protein
MERSPLRIRFPVLHTRRRIGPQVSATWASSAPPHLPSPGLAGWAGASPDAAARSAIAERRSQTTLARRQRLRQPTPDSDSPPPPPPPPPDPAHRRHPTHQGCRRELAGVLGPSARFSRWSGPQRRGHGGRKIVEIGIASRRLLAPRESAASACLAAPPPASRTTRNRLVRALASGARGSWLHRQLADRESRLRRSACMRPALTRADVRRREYAGHRTSATIHMCACSCREVAPIARSARSARPLTRAFARCIAK